MRKLRYLPQSRTLVSITNRTIQGRYLLTPGTSFNDLFLGILGKAQRMHEMDSAAATVLSSHFHLLLIVDDAKEVADFMRDLQSKAAREVNRLTGWKGSVFERRYEMTVARRQSGARVLGAKAILAQDPLTRPDSVACSPAPLVHAATKAARKMFYAIYAEFVGAFQAAAEVARS